jgi:hypothetical protein
LCCAVAVGYAAGVTSRRGRGSRRTDGAGVKPKLHEHCLWAVDARGRRRSDVGGVDEGWRRSTRWWSAPAGLNSLAAFSMYHHPFKKSPRSGCFKHMRRWPSSGAWPCLHARQRSARCRSSLARLPPGQRHSPNVAPWLRLGVFISRSLFGGWCQCQWCESF